MKNRTISKYTSTANQRQFILTYLQEHGNANTHEFRDMGLMSPAQRISELKKQGYDIRKSMEVSVDHVGVKHGNVARYYLSVNADGDG